MSKLKVYGWTYAGRTRKIVAARSVAEAARLSGSTRYDITQYGAVTENTEEVATATAAPGTVFYRSVNARPGDVWEHSA